MERNKGQHFLYPIVKNIKFNAQYVDKGMF